MKPPFEDSFICFELCFTIFILVNFLSVRCCLIAYFRGLIAFKVPLISLPTRIRDLQLYLLHIYFYLLFTL